MAEGAAISGNKRHGVLAGYGGKVTVAAAQHTEDESTADRPQTVSTGNSERGWATEQGGEIEGLADGIQVNA